MNAITYQGASEYIESDNAELTAVKVKDLKKGEYFILSNKAKTVYEKGEYDRSDKRYVCDDYSDISKAKFLKGDKIVLIGFTF